MDFSTSLSLYSHLNEAHNYSENGANSKTENEEGIHFNNQMIREESASQKNLKTEFKTMHNVNECVESVNEKSHINSKSRD